MSRLVLFLIAAAVGVIVFRKATADQGGTYDPQRDR